MSYHITGPLPKKKVSPSEKVEKATKMFDDIEEPVFIIGGKYLDNFQVQFTRSTRWFNLDCEWLKDFFNT